MAENPVFVLHDTIGSVRLVNRMGDDTSIVNAARISYASNDTVRTTEENTRLINYLMEHDHTSPFEQVEFVFHVVAPMFVARQWLRHRTAHVNEQSARYSEMIEAFYLPPADTLCKQSELNKQGRDSSAPISNADAHIDAMRACCTAAYQVYKNAIDAGMAREVARIILPVNMYTQFVWKIDLHNLLHFLRLRLHSTAQYEIRCYAAAIGDIVARYVPATMAAFRRFKLLSITFSADEVHAIATGQHTLTDSRRKQQEFESKLKQLKLI